MIDMLEGVLTIFADAMGVGGHEKLWGFHLTSAGYEHASYKSRRGYHESYRKRNRERRRLAQAAYLSANRDAIAAKKRARRAEQAAKRATSAG